MSDNIEMSEIIYIEDNEGIRHRYKKADLIDKDEFYSNLQLFTFKYGVPNIVEVNEKTRDNIWRYFSHSGGPLPEDRIPEYVNGVLMGYSGKYTTQWINLDNELRLAVRVVDLQDYSYSFVIEIPVAKETYGDR